jgi:hypothetical protein
MRSLVEEDESLGAEPGRPNELSRSHGWVQSPCDGFRARLAAASSSPARRGRTLSWSRSGSRVVDEVLSVKAFDSVLQA